MIEADNICFYIHDEIVLDHVSFEVNKGESLALVGLNGAGKTTVLRLLAGIYKPRSGRILVDGLPIFENKHVKYRISYIADHITNLGLPNVKSLINLERSIWPDWNDSFFHAMLDDLSITDSGNLRNMSIGLIRKLCLCVALSRGADIIVMDEPLDSLDQVSRRTIWSWLMRLMSEHSVTVVYSTHNLNVIESIADKVVMLNHGKVELYGNVDSVTDDYYKVTLPHNNKYGSRLFNDGVEIITYRNQNLYDEYMIKARIETLNQMPHIKNDLCIDIRKLTIEELHRVKLGLNAFTRDDTRDALNLKGGIELHG